MQWICDAKSGEGVSPDRQSGDGSAGPFTTAKRGNAFGNGNANGGATDFVYRIFYGDGRAAGTGEPVPGTIRTRTELINNGEGKALGACDEESEGWA